jgi:hypothetical protein
VASFTIRGLEMGRDALEMRKIFHSCQELNPDFSFI